MSNKTQSVYPAAKVARFVWQVARPFPGALLVLILVAICWAADASLRSYFLKMLIDQVADPVPDRLFSHVAFSAGGILFLSFMMSTVFRLYGYFVEIKMIPVMRTKIANCNFGTLLGHGHSFFQNNFSGSLANRISDLVMAVPDIIQIVFDRFLATFLTLIIAIYTLSQVHPKFGIAMFLWSLSLLLGGFILTKHFSRLAAAWSEAGARISGEIVDVLSNSLSVKLFSHKRAEKENLDRLFNKATQAEQKLQWAYFWIWCVYGFSFTFVLGLNLYFLIKGRQEGWVSAGDFALVLGINTTIVNFLWEIMKDFSQFSKLFGRISQALSMIHVPYDLEDVPDAKPLVIASKNGGEILFDQVQFQYNGTTPLFQNKSIIIHFGEKVGLVGYSGGGKTTFVNLILRLYDVQAGRILIDCQDIAKVTQDSLRAAIGMIPQDPSLFHRSLRENIRYGRPDASDQEVEEAAKKAHAHGFICHLPAGYDALVGERGVKLSGGQRQRIAIARAILKNAPILILDEATSQLDSVTEQDIQDSLWNLMQDKTTIVVAHRLSTLIRMDRILVFDQGKIVQDGSHLELLSQEGLYKTLWDAQVGGFLPDRLPEEEDEQVGELPTNSPLPTCDNLP